MKTTYLCAFLILIQITHLSWNSAVPAEAPLGSEPLHQIKKIAADPKSPIKFDEKMNEYLLVYKSFEGGVLTEQEWILKYCPFTGEKLPLSKRSGLFAEPRDQDVKKYQKLLSGAKTLAEIEKILGQPDKIYEMLGEEPEQFTYNSLPEDIILIVKRVKDGRIVLNFTGKEKKPSEKSQQTNKK